MKDNWYSSYTETLMKYAVFSGRTLRREFWEFFLKRSCLNAQPHISDFGKSFS